MTRVAFALIASALAALAACSSQASHASEAAKPEPLPVASVPMRPPAASASASSATAKPVIDTKGWDKDRPKGWTDPRVVSALSVDCEFVPPPPPRDTGMSTPGDIFACTLPWSQSCAPNPCNAYTTHCESSCQNTCGACNTKCTDACKTCKTTCTDDACRRACAGSCADCKQTCGRGLDRCATGGCNKDHDACAARLKATWKTNGCAAKCKTYQRCDDACVNRGLPEGCREKCQKALGSSYEACDEKCTGDDELCHVKCVENGACSWQLCMMPP